MLNPLRLYLYWIALCIFFYLLIPVLSTNSDSSAQVPFVLGIYALLALICGTFTISIIDMWMFKKWFKQFWYVNVAVTLCLGAVIVLFLGKMIA